MNIPPEFKDYLVTRSHLSPAEQSERFKKMHEVEIAERTRILRSLDFNKEETKKRIKKYIEWGFEQFDIPEFYNSVDSIVEKEYSKPLAHRW